MLSRGKLMISLCNKEDAANEASNSSLLSTSVVAAIEKDDTVNEASNSSSLSTLVAAVNEKTENGESFGIYSVASTSNSRYEENILPKVTIPINLSDVETSDEFVPGTSESENSSSSDSEKHKTSTKMSRWKKSTPSKWLVNKTVHKRKNGLPYKSKTGRMQKAKKPIDIDCSKCRYKCSTNFDQQFRENNYLEFWKLNYDRQKDFILSCVQSTAPKTRRVRTGTAVRKESSRVYNFSKHGQKLRVCKNYFLKTLCISHGLVDNALAGVDEAGIFTAKDKRGHKEPGNKTSPELIAKIKSHIESFPTVGSHYCRKTTKRQYLDSKLSITKMYDLYVEQCKANEEKHVSQITYRRIFSQEYNLSFFKPKKDQCQICENFENNKNNPEKVATLQTEYDEHIRRRNEANIAKNADKVRASETDYFVSVTFDLQSVLQIPCSEVSQMYYTRKLCAYNLTVYESALPHNAFCFAWSEINGQRGSCEIGTALLSWIRLLPKNITQVSLFSDTCSGQNRNQNIAALFLYVVKITNIEVLEHKFLEKGHSYMECDSMHSAIESVKRRMTVYSMHDWLNIFRVARSKRLRNKTGECYHVRELLYTDFVDLKSLAGQVIKNRTVDSNGNKVNWLKIKVMRYEKEKPGCILFKYNYSDEEYNILQVTGRGRPSTIPITLGSLYKKQLPISQKKKNDRLKLCNTNVIPPEFHEWYNSLPVDNKKNDVAPEPSAFSDSEESE